MNKKMYLTAVVVLSMFIAPSMSSMAEEPYSHVITDPEDDVNHIHGTGWTFDVERPNIDIIRAEVFESGGTVTFLLTVKGTILSHENISYYMYLDDDEDGFYMVNYIDDYCQIWASNDKGWSMYEVEASGIGTDTLVVTTTLEELLNPDMLRFNAVYTYDHVDYGEYYWDYAYPEDDDDDNGFIPVNHSLSVYPTYGTAPLTVDIVAEVENIGDGEGEVAITIDGTVVDLVFVGPNGHATWTLDHTFDEPGTYVMRFGDEMTSVTVEPDEPYSHVITDPEGDVIKWMSETEWVFVQNPDIDITEVEIYEVDGMVTVSLTVKGNIRDHPDIQYIIHMIDGNQGEFNIDYHNGICEVMASIGYDTGGFANRFEAATNIVGTNTLVVHFNRAQIGNPEILWISYVATYDEGNREVDYAGPDAEYPPGYDDNGDDNGDENGAPGNGDDGDDNEEAPPDDNGDDDDSPGFAFLLMGFALISAVLIYTKKNI